MKTKDAALQLKHREFAFKADQVQEDGTFTGYGSVFGNVDFGRDVVAPGAFAKSIAKFKAAGNPLPMLWQHKDSEPIGGYTDLAEDHHGLKVTGFLLKDEIPRAKEAYALLKRKVVRGLSIGYYIIDSSYNEKENILTLLELELVEISIVTFGMNEMALISDVKSALVKGGKMPTMREFEDFLCEAGFSNTEAKAVAGNGLRKLLAQREAGGKHNSEQHVLKALQDFSLQ